MIELLKHFYLFYSKQLITIFYLRRQKIVLQMQPTNTIYESNNIESNNVLLSYNTQPKLIWKAQKNYNNAHRYKFRLPSGAP